MGLGTHQTVKNLRPVDSTGCTHIALWDGHTELATSCSTGSAARLVVCVQQLPVPGERRYAPLDFQDILLHSLAVVVDGVLALLRQRGCEELVTTSDP